MINTAILVEGKNDRLFLEWLLAHNNYTLPAEHKIIAIGGKAFKEQIKKLRRILYFKTLIMGQIKLIIMNLKLHKFSLLKIVMSVINMKKNLPTIYKLQNIKTILWYHFAIS